MNKADRTRNTAIREMTCVVCGHPPPSMPHHTDTGMGRRHDSQKTIPLCFNHHQGDEGINGVKMGRKTWEARYGTEEELLAKTNETMEGIMSWPIPRLSV